MAQTPFFVFSTRQLDAVFVSTRRCFARLLRWRDQQKTSDENTSDAGKNTYEKMGIYTLEDERLEAANHP